MTHSYPWPAAAHTALTSVLVPVGVIACCVHEVVVVSLLMRKRGSEFGARDNVAGQRDPDAALAAARAALVSVPGRGRVVCVGTGMALGVGSAVLLPAGTVPARASCAGAGMRRRPAAGSKQLPAGLPPSPQPSKHAVPRLVVCRLSRWQYVDSFGGTRRGGTVMTAPQGGGREGSWQPDDSARRQQCRAAAFVVTPPHWSGTPRATAHAAPALQRLRRRPSPAVHGGW